MTGAEVIEQNTPTGPVSPIIREAHRKALTSLSRSQWFRLEQEGKAPRRVKLTPDGSAHGWPLTEIEQWIRDRMAERSSASCG